MPDHAGRIERLRARMAEAGAGCLFLPQSADLEYLTGVPRVRHTSDVDWDVELLVEGCFIGIESGPLFLLTHSEWSIPAAAALSAWEARHMPADDDPVTWLRQAFEDTAGAGALAVGERTRFDQLRALEEAVGRRDFRPSRPLMLPLRASKDEDEIAAVRHAGAIAKAALEEVLPQFGTSFGRRDFLLALEQALVRNGSERVAYAPDFFATGPTTSVAWSADVVADPNAIVTAPAGISLDFGAVHQGYRSDVGRTIWVGEPPPGHEDALAAVRAAVDAACGLLAPGVPGEQVDRAARGVMEEAGLGDAFWIPAGHGIGLELHEPPRFRAGYTDPVAENAVVTVEIGAWREGTLSAFWEDDVVVRGDGAERLTEGPDGAYVIA